MWQKLLARREKFTEGAAVLTITTFLSYATGLVRDRIFAHTFGASRELDIYNASFIIPDLLLNILIASALSAAFIPIFTSLNATGEREQANELGNSVLHSAFFVIMIAGVLAAIFMPQLSQLIAPGFSGEEQALLVKAARLMLISPLIMTISNTLGSMLIGFRNFLPYGLSPILYNIGIIAGVLLLPQFGVYGIVLGTLAGALLHVLPRLLAMPVTSFRYSFSANLRSPNFKKVIRLMIPKMLGHPVEQITFMAFTRIATMLAAGSVTAMSFARNFQSVPVSLFGISFSVAIFPLLAECAARGDREKFLKNFRKALRDILIFTVPCAIGLYFLSELPIRILLGGGKFSDENIVRTASILSIFALSIPTESLVHILARSFYALKNTAIPVAASIFGLIIGIGFAYYKAPEIGMAAIPYGFFIGSVSEVILLGIILRRFLKRAM